MKVYALIGKSGTGKSHRAMVVAYEHGIDTLIDDGLLIKDGCKLAGQSAKREATSLQAVKRAIFLDPQHVKEVRKCIDKENPSRILILGTSLRMVERIAKALSLPAPCKVIGIEDVATEKEIELAHELRTNHGMHVIPVPTIEVKKDFPGYLVDPLKYFFVRKNRHRVGEKSIIRPKFSMIGKLLISEHAVSQISSYVVMRLPEVVQINKIHVNMMEDGVKVYLEVTGRYGDYLPDVGKAVYGNVQDSLENLTGLVVYGVQVVIKSLKH